MSVTAYVGRTCSGFLDRLLCVLGAVVFSQGPEFIQQYLQRLGGHVDEARRQVAQFQQTAQQSGKSLEEFITQTNANSDAAVAKLGGVMAQASERLHNLENSQAAISSASVFERPFVFLKHVDNQIAQSTWSIFKPAIPATPEGVAYAVIGMLLFFLLYHLAFRLPATVGYRSWRRRRAERQLA